MKNDQRLLEWPQGGLTRAPFRVMSDPEIYAQEQERIFRGPVWNYLCLEAEIADPASYRTTFIGDTPVIVARDQDGSIHAMINRCAHKGALLCPEAGGKKKNFTCAYHGWTYDLQGKLRGVPFQNGVGGKGGMPEDFDLAQHGLERLRAESFHGLVFGAFSDSVEPLETYLGPGMAAHIRRVFHKPVEVLGYHHQVLHNNWKLYMENSRDPYHATILHTFYATFKLNRLTMDGGVTMDHDGWHSINYSKGATFREGGYEPGISIFPSCVHQQIYNTLALRQLVAQGPGQSELHWTFFEYQDDDPALRQMQLKQSNLIGPAGYVSIDDGVIAEYVQRGIAGKGIEASAVMEMGGRDVQSTAGSRVTEVSLRGFWNGYRSLMGF